MTPLVTNVPVYPMHLRPQQHHFSWCETVVVVTDPEPCAYVDWSRVEQIGIINVGKDGHVTIRDWHING